MSISTIIKKHKKPIMIGGGVALVLYLMSRGKSTGTSTMAIGPTVEQLKAITGNGSLGSLE